MFARNRMTARQVLPGLPASRSSSSGQRGAHPHRDQQNTTVRLVGASTTYWGSQVPADRFESRLGLFAYHPLPFLLIRRNSQPNRCKAPIIRAPVRACRRTAPLWRLIAVQLRPSRVIPPYLSNRFDRENHLLQQEFNSVAVEETILTKQSQAHLIHCLGETRECGKHNSLPRSTVMVS